MTLDIVVRYRDVVHELSLARRRLADAMKAAARAKVDGFESSTATGVSAREHDAERFAISEHADVVDCRLEVDVLDDERLLLRDLLKLGHRTM